MKIGRGRLPTAAHEPSGFGTGVLAALEDGGAGDQGRLIAFGSLYEALAAGGEVVDDLGRVQAQAVEIDQAWCTPAMMRRQRSGSVGRSTETNADLGLQTVLDRIGELPRVRPQVEVGQ